MPYGIYIEDYSELEKEAWEIAHIDLIDEDLLEAGIDPFADLNLKKMELIDKNGIVKIEDTKESN